MVACPQVFSSEGTCTLLPSFLGVHPIFWGCNVPSNSSFGGTKKMNCIFSPQGHAPCCFTPKKLDVPPKMKVKEYMYPQMKKPVGMLIMFDTRMQVRCTCISLFNLTRLCHPWASEVVQDFLTPDMTQSCQIKQRYTCTSHLHPCVKHNQHAVQHVQCILV
jgi:hypothetical protein